MDESSGGSPRATSPPSSTSTHTELPPVVRNRRRHSDRVMSPSDSSDSSSEDGQERHRFDRQVSAPVETTRKFPTSAAASTFPIENNQIQDKRMRTLSDSSRYDSPLAAKTRGITPPSAFGGIGMGFARPSPARRKRLSSSESFIDRTGSRSPEYSAASFGRSGSVAGIHAVLASPGSDPRSLPSSPISPVDTTSFHARATSGESSRSEVDQAEDYLNDAVQGQTENAHHLGDDQLSATGPRLGKLAVRLHPFHVFIC